MTLVVWRSGSNRFYKTYHKSKIQRRIIISGYVVNGATSHFNNKGTDRVRVIYLFKFFDVYTTVFEDTVSCRSL